MTFSIVIPARNGERFLYAAIVSALSQKREADEIVVVDDASDDQTAAIAHMPEFAGKVSYRLNAEPTGFADAWNRAASLANGDFVTILHQDDILHEDYLLHIERALTSHPDVRHVYAACNYIDESGLVTGEPPLPHSLEPQLYSGKKYASLYLNGVCLNRHIHRCPGVTTSREILMNTCSYRKEAGQIADDDFFLRVGACTDVIGISAPLACFRHHGGSVTGNIDNLTRTLAENYLFQVRYYASGAGILGSEDILKINSLAIRFINQLRFQSVISGDLNGAKRAQELKREVDNNAPGLFISRLPPWADLMWRIAGSADCPGSVEKIYATAMEALIRFRQVLSRS